MTLKLGNLSDWRRAPEDALVVLKAPEAAGDRLVRLDVNGPSVMVHLMQPGKDAVFLAEVHGLERIEFYAEGEVRLSICGAEAWYFTSDGIPTHVELTDAQSLTRIMRRRERNPQLELMQYLAQQNIERRFEAMQDEFDRRVAAAVAGANPQTGEIEDDDAEGGGDGEAAAGGAPGGAGDGVADAEAAAASGGDGAAGAAAGGAGKRSPQRAAGARRPAVSDKAGV